MIPFEVTQFYDQQFTMFASPGWQQFIKDQAIARRTMLEMLSNPNLDAAATAYYRGELHRIDMLLMYEQLTRAAFDNVKEQDRLGHQSGDED